MSRYIKTICYPPSTPHAALEASIPLETATLWRRRNGKDTGLDIHFFLRNPSTRLCDYEVQIMNIWVRVHASLDRLFSHGNPRPIRTLGHMTRPHRRRRGGRWRLGSAWSQEEGFLAFPPGRDRPMVRALFSLCITISIKPSLNYSLFSARAFFSFVFGVLFISNWKIRVQLLKQV